MKPEQSAPKELLLLQRTNITKWIQNLGHDAQVEEEKATPRCLRKLYQTTQASIQDEISLLVLQTYDRMLEAEQRAIGWRQMEAAGGGK